MLVLDFHLLCKGFQDRVGEKYDKIISPFSVCLTGGDNDKREWVSRMWQSTLHDDLGSLWVFSCTWKIFCSRNLIG